MSLIDRIDLARVCHELLRLVAKANWPRDEAKTTVTFEFAELDSFYAAHMDLEHLLNDRNPDIGMPPAFQSVRVAETPDGGKIAELDSFMSIKFVLRCNQRYIGPKRSYPIYRKLSIEK